MLRLNTKTHAAASCLLCNPTVWDILKYYAQSNV